MGEGLAGLGRHEVEDLERNDGTPERPYLMSDNLLNVLKKKNQAN